MTLPQNYLRGVHMEVSNKIKVIELDGKQEEYANFEGVQLRNKGINRYY